VCCKAIDPPGARDYADLLLELDADERVWFTARTVERCIAGQAPKDAESARAILLELIDGRAERLEELLKRHQERDEAAGVDRFGFDDSKEGEQMRSYQLGCNRALMRILDTFLKYRREMERAASGEAGLERPGPSRRARTDGGPQEVRAPTEFPPGRPEMIAPLSEDPAPGIDEPSAVMPTDFPAVAPVLPVEPPPPADAPAHRALADENTTNEPRRPAGGAHLPIGTTVLALLALLLGLGLTAVFAAAVKAMETSPPPQKQGEVSRSQVLFSKALQSIDRPSLSAPISGHAASGQSMGRPGNLTADTLIDRSTKDDETRIYAPMYRSRPPNERDGPSAG
jgi:hypothetical protein